MRTACFERIDREIFLNATQEIEVALFEGEWSAIDVFADGLNTFWSLGATVKVYAANPGTGGFALLYSGTLATVLQNWPIHGVGGHAARYRVTIRMGGAGDNTRTASVRVAALAYGGEPS